MRTFICTLVALATLSASADRGNSIHQPEIDAAYELIFQTQLGRSICRQILGASRDAIEFHLGVSHRAAQTIAARCTPSTRHRWIYSTQPADIRKLTLKASSPRKYKVLVSNVSFPIESWTEPFTNTTVLVTPTLPLSPERWVQILAHETAVYFDSKVNPSHPDAEQIPQLRQLSFLTPAGNKLDPFIAFSNPLHGHAMTFVRALQVEYEIVQDLVRQEKLKSSEPLFDSAQLKIVSSACGHECLQNLIVRLRSTLLPIGLPLLAFAPYYRSLILTELPRLQLDWGDATWQRAQQVLNHLPVEFLKTQFGGDPVTDMKKVFFAGPGEDQRFSEVSSFLDQDLWPLEQNALFNTQVISRGKHESLLEFMKRPLLSGYNVGLSSGPRVRIRTGNIE